MVAKHFLDIGDNFIMANPYPVRPGEADCRDYLRTGRCKYGESCKYNHPPGVENGGGVKPINPSEPLFPVRPTEPPCQYFLKHGTCKFGQSCKFNHPSGAALSDGSGGLPAGQLVFVTTNTPGGAVSGDATSHLMSSTTSVQVLPQRPTEPNCIYFLRNGKCKYGATCKFHHPLDAMNRSNQVQHIQAANIRPSHNARDRSHSLGSASDGRSQVQHNLPYPANVSFVQQQQRLQPITERARPQQPTHILLPDGQIAVILDPQSLQNVSDLSAQERPKYYLSQTDGSASLGTLSSMQSIDQSNATLSPMLTATTTSTSNQTFDSSINSYQGQPPGTPSRGPQKSGSGGSLSAYGSLDSGFHPQVEYHQPVSGQVRPTRRMSPELGGTQASFPQYAAWPMSDAADQSHQAQARRQSSNADGLDRTLRAGNTNLDSVADNSSAYFWPTSGSFSKIPEHHDSQAGQPYISMPNSSPYGSSNEVGRPINHSYSVERTASISPSTSSEMHGRPENSQRPQESSGEDCEGLTMMTSALLTMMDRNDETPLEQSRPNAPKSPNHASLGDVFYSQSEPNLPLRERASPMRPPPGMTNPMSSDDHGYPSEFNRDLTSSKSPPAAGGGYFVGGYEQPPPRSPPWGD